MSSDIIDEVLMESEIDWYEMAENLLRKKFPNYNEQQTPKMKQKFGNICYHTDFVAMNLLI